MGDAEIGSRGTPGKARSHLNRCSQHLEYLIAVLKYSLLNDRVIGIYNAGAITEELYNKCIW